MRFVHLIVAALAWLGASVSAFAGEPAKITLGVVPSVPAGATYIAVEKGYFRDAGIAVEMQNIESSATAMALLAGNRMQVVEGGVAPNYWNALAQGLPVILALERASTPLYHDMLIRRELVGVLKTPADLKGRVVAENAPGSSAHYEIGRAQLEGCRDQIPAVPADGVGAGQWRGRCRRRGASLRLDGGRGGAGRQMDRS